MNSLYWSVRRELWENRSIYLAPLVGVCVVLAGFSIGLFTLSSRVRAAASNPVGLHQIIEVPFVMAAIILMGIELVVAIFYCLDALYGERRDRSILFWKSMPISDLTAVVSKASIPILVIPLMAFVATVVTQVVMLVISGMVLSANGISSSMVWDQMSLADIVTINFGHVVAFHGIWYAPLYAWLLLVSAWATRLPFLWATLPPAAIVVIERVAFNSAHFAGLLQVLFFGFPQADAPSASVMHGMTMEMMALPFGQFLLGPGLWIGLVASAVLLLGAARLRRVRTAI
jgi:ABC-2 type transport system permease protein